MALRVLDRTERLKPCPECGGEFPHVTGFVEASGATHSAYFASCHDHDHRAAWIDVVLGTWGAEPPPKDHVIFSCGLRADGAMAVDAPVAVDLSVPVPESAAALLGRALSRQEALGHPWIVEFWAAIDAIGAQDPAVAQQVYGHT